MMLSNYTGGNKGWGNFIGRCAECNAVIFEATTDENGKIKEVIYDEIANHVCDFIYEDDDWENRSCGDCPDDECTGHCFSCCYRTV